MIGRKVGGGGNGNGWQEDIMYTLDTAGGGFAVCIIEDDIDNAMDIPTDVLRRQRKTERPTERRSVYNGERDGS